MLNDALARLYGLLHRLGAACGRPRLADCNGRSAWPHRGVYFFYEDGEVRDDGTPRVVRVGTHAVSAGSRTTLWKRLSQHRGSASGVGNHRGSIFRLHSGTAMLARGDAGAPAAAAATWGRSARPVDPAARQAERAVELSVSAHLGRMRVVWLEVDDPPGRESRRALLERNAIALLAAARRAGTDPPSTRWLGNWSDRPAVRQSGLWNVNHTTAATDTGWLDTVESWTTE